jgi:hypothetical protein
MSVAIGDRNGEDDKKLFFTKVRESISIPLSKLYPKWTRGDVRLKRGLSTAKKTIHTALCNNYISIAYRMQMFALKDIIRVSNPSLL